METVKLDHLRSEADYPLAVAALRAKLDISCGKMT
jgi:hypothetical protein